MLRQFSAHEYDLVDFLSLRRHDQIGDYIRRDEKVKIVKAALEEEKHRVRTYDNSNILLQDDMRDWRLSKPHMRKQDARFNTSEEDQGTRTGHVM